MFYPRRHITNEEKDQRQRQVKPMVFPKSDIPPYVDLRKWMSPIEQQSDMSTCCANAFAGICEYLIKRFLNRHMDVSRLFIYYNGQVLSQRTLNVSDQGVEQKNIALGLRKYGVCEEKYWPYREDKLNVEPPPDVYEKASRFTVIPLRVPCTVRAVQICLRNQVPVLVDLKIVDNSHDIIIANDGYLPMPDLTHTAANRITLHTVVIVGYDQKTQHFTIRNSWGEEWGYGGYCYIPYGYLTDDRLHNFTDTLWTITSIVLRGNKLPSVRYLVVPPPQHQKAYRHQHRHQHRYH